jgi:hypothetical protein
MASTKRKRRTKHRGNAAGIVETRGRTGRKPTAQERKSQSRRDRLDRFSKPPTWRGAFNRAIVAVVIFVAVIVLLLHQNPVSGIALGAFLLLFYVPMTYYMDLWFYRRRQAKLGGGSEQGRR